MKSKLNVLSLACATAMLMAMGGAHAAGSATFGVTGIITPNSCNVSLAGGGINDYGTKLKTAVQGLPLVNGVAYSLGVKTLTATVSCSAPTKVEIQFVDNNSADRFNLGDGLDVIRYGVADGTLSTPVGGYNAGFTNVILDGAAAAGALLAPNGTAAWSSTGPAGTGTLTASPGYTMGFIKTAGNTVPDAFTLMTGTWNTSLFVSKAYVDASTNTIQLNGTGTMTLVYQ
ncbi:DUF1120 domain-containing protein [Burkholderia territorii]|uniref:DUF1120 domain-containing protein n=1 Tax=Burkholderia territorii TaxID=1503055 RepID=UPI0009BCD084|nr:DUF1120 domain-containing protein [Burkholderia territorii]